MTDQVEIGPDNKNWTKSQRKEPLMRPKPVEWDGLNNFILYLVTGRVIRKDRPN